MPLIPLDSTEDIWPVDNADLGFSAGPASQQSGQGSFLQSQIQPSPQPVQPQQTQTQAHNYLDDPFFIQKSVEANKQTLRQMRPKPFLIPLDIKDENGQGYAEPTPIAPVTETPDTEYHWAGAFKEAGYDIARTAGASFPSAVGKAFDFVNRAEPGDESTLTKIGEENKAKYDLWKKKSVDIEDLNKAIAKHTESYVTQAVAQSGNTLGALAVQAAGTAAGSLVGMPWLGTALSSGTFQDLNVEDVYNQAIEKGATPEAAKKAGYINGTIDTILDSVQLKALKGVFKPASDFTNFLWKLGATSLFTEGGLEGIQGVQETIGAEWAAKPKDETPSQFAQRMWDKKSDLWQTFKDNAITAAIMSAGLGVPGHIIESASSKQIVNGVRDGLENGQLTPDKVRTMLDSNLKNVGDFTKKKIENLISKKQEIAATEEPPIPDAPPEKLIPLDEENIPIPTEEQAQLDRVSQPGQLPGQPIMTEPGQADAPTEAITQASDITPAPVIIEQPVQIADVPSAQTVTEPSGTATPALQTTPDVSTQGTGQPSGIESPPALTEAGPQEGVPAYVPDAQKVTGPSELAAPAQEEKTAQPGQAAGQLSEDTKINGVTFAQLEDLIINDKPGIKKELEDIKALHGREGMQDLVNPGKLYARLRRRLVAEQGMSKERAIDLLQGPFERYEQQFREVEGEEQNAQTVRSNQGQVQETGVIRPEGQEQGSGDLRGRGKDQTGKVTESQETARLEKQPWDQSDTHLESVWNNDLNQAGREQAARDIGYSPQQSVRLSKLIWRHIPEKHKEAFRDKKDSWIKHPETEQSQEQPQPTAKEFLTVAPQVSPRIQKIIDTANNGDPALKSTQAARRMLDKKGIEWEGKQKVLPSKPEPYQEEMKRRADEQYAGWKGHENAITSPQALKEKAAREKRKRMANNAQNAPNFRAWVRAKGGLTTPTLKDHGLLNDKTYIGIRNKNGMGTDEMLHMAILDGWLQEGATEEDFVNAIEKNSKKPDQAEQNLLKAHEDDYNKYISQLEAEARDGGATDQDIDEAKRSGEEETLGVFEGEISPSEEAELVSIFGKDWDKPQSSTLVLTSEEGTAWDKGEVKNLGSQGKKAVFPTEKIKTAEYKNQGNLFETKEGEQTGLFYQEGKTKLQLSPQSLRDHQIAVSQFRNWMRRAGLPEDAVSRLEIQVRDHLKLIGDYRQSMKEHGNKPFMEPIAATTFLDDMRTLVQLSTKMDLIKAENTAYHEAFHVMAEHLLDDAGRTALMDHYKGNEEHAANAFASFVVGEETKSLPKSIRKVFYQIKRALVRIKNAFGQSQYKTPEDFFKALYFGAYKGQNLIFEGKPVTKASMTLKQRSGDITTTKTSESPMGGIQDVAKTEPELKNDGEHLYHYTPYNFIKDIKENGLSSKHEQLESRSTDIQSDIEGYLYGLTYSNGDIFYNAIARDAGPYDKWAVLRFKKDLGDKWGWEPDPEFDPNEFDGSLRHYGLEINPKDLEILTDTGWKNLSDIGLPNRTSPPEKGGAMPALPESKLRLAETAKEFHADMRTFTGDAINAIKNISDTRKIWSANKASRKADTTFFDRYFRTPFFSFRKVDTAWRMFEDGEKRSDNFYEQVDNLTKTEDGQHWTIKLDNAKKQIPEEYKKIKAIFKHNDQNKIGYTVKKDEGTEFILPSYTLSDPKGKEVGKFASEEEAWEQAIQRDLASLKAKGFSDQGIDAAEAIMRMRHNGFNLLSANIKSVIAEYERLGIPLPVQTVWDNGEKIEVNLENELARMGDMRGYYMPRSWRPGRIILYARKKGVHPRIETFDFDGPIMANRQRKLQEEGYSVESKVSGPMPEDVFEMAGQTVAVNAMLNEALDRLKKTPPTLDSFGLKGEFVDGPGKNKDFMLIGPTNKRQGKVLKDMGGKWYQSKEDTVEHWHFVNAPKDIEKRLTKALGTSEVSKKIDEETAKLFAGGLAEQVGNIIKERGSRKHMVRRSDAVGLDVWEGYEEDPAIAMAQYVRGLAAGEAKHKMAIAMVRHMTGTDISWSDYKNMIKEETEGLPEYDEYLNFVNNRRIDPIQQPNIFKDTTAFMKDMLRNQETSDRVIGVIKGLAVLKYLGLKLSALPINMSAMVSTVPASMKGYANIGFGKSFSLMAKMSKLYIQFRRYRRTGNKALLPQRYIDLFEEMEKKGWGKPQYNREALSTLESKVGQGYSKLIEMSMVPFAITENFNRMVTISSAYEGARAQGKTHEEALAIGKDVSDHAHAVYGKVNYPHLLRGDNLAAQTLKCGYVFKQFNHNYLQTMWDLGYNKKDAKATMWMAASPMFLGGLGAFAGTALIKAALQALGADDPEEWFYNQVEENLGQKAGTVARVGVPGLFGVSLKGSLAIDLTGIPTKPAELLGAPGSVIGDIYEGGRQLSKGNTSKGIEKLLPTVLASPVKAIREAREGVTTSGNLPVYYGNKPLMADTADAVIRFLGFSPAHIATAREKQWNERQIEQKYTEQRAEIYGQFHKYFLMPPEDRNKAKYLDLLTKVNQYNNRLFSSGLIEKGYSPITPKLLRANIKRGFKPSKKEQLRKENHVQ